MAASAAARGSVTGSCGHERDGRGLCRVDGALSSALPGDDQIRIAGTFGWLADTYRAWN